jgi:hypothetical protein
MHAWPVHATAAPHVPVALQVCTPLPEHRVVLGAHTPAHPPATQAWFAHATAVPHVPVAVQVCTPLPEH